MPRKPKETSKQVEARLRKEIADMYPNGFLTDEDMEIIFKAAGHFNGQYPVLASAIGCFVLSKLLGWRAIRILHGGAVYAKYQRILGIEFTDHCPEEGPFVEASLGYEITKKLGEFWKVVRGQISIPSRQELKSTLPDENS
jgi:hypothetical protein